MQSDELREVEHVCSECGDPVSKAGMCTDCNTEFWQALMMEEADRFAPIENEVPARG